MTWLDEFKNEIVSNRSRKLKLENEIKGINELLTHLEAVYRHYSGSSALEEVENYESMEKYKHLSNAQIVLHWCNDNNGVIETKYANKAFEAKMPGSTNSSSAMFSAINRLVKQGKLEKDRQRKGLYYLTEEGRSNIADESASLGTEYGQRMIPLEVEDNQSDENNLYNNLIPKSESLVSIADMAKIAQMYEFGQSDPNTKEVGE